MTEEQTLKPESEDQDQVAEPVQVEGPAAEAVPESQVESMPGERGDIHEDEEVGDLDALRQDLEEARAKEAEYLDGWQRARAELSNARKRFERERQSAYAYAKADLLVRLLPIIDDLERASETLPGDLANHAWVEGVKLVQQKAHGLLEQEGVAPIHAVGKEFDPLLHQAVTHEPSGEVPEGHVIAEMQRGYSIGDRVLRPCMVRVSAGPLPEPEPEEEPAPEEQAHGAEEETASTEES